MPNDKKSDYKRGEATAFAMHAISHLNSIRQRQLKTRQKLMEKEMERAQVMSVGEQVLESEGGEGMQSPDAPDSPYRNPRNAL